MNEVMADWEVSARRGRGTDGGVDQYGERIPGVLEWVDLPPALLSPKSDSVALEPGVDSVLSNPTLYWGGSAQLIDVQAGDVLEVGGVEYSVLGEPERWPLGTVVHLTQVKGGWQ